MPAGGTKQTPMTDHDATPAHDADQPDDGHAGGHGDHHNGGTLGPIDWKMWGVGVVGFVAALLVLAAFMVATGYLHLDVFTA